MPINSHYAISLIQFIAINEKTSKYELTTAFYQLLNKCEVTILGFLLIIILLLILILFFLIIKQRKDKQHLWKIVYTDSLTGIGNLNLFCKDIRKLLDKNSATHYLVAKFDIENFKLLNEIYGYERGDQLIKGIAKTMSKLAVPGIDTCARISGNEFIFLKSYMDRNSIEQFRLESEKLFLKTFSHEFDNLLKLRYGIYYIEDNKENVVTIIEKVSYAHSVSKNTRNISKFIYDEGVKQRAVEEKRIEARMDEALQKKQFILYLQPKYYLADESLAGAEALVRWSSEDGTNIVYPNSFIPLFEQNGFITKLDMYMLERSCELIREWIDNGITPVAISINFSRLHLLNPEFIKELCTVTDRFDIPRKYIEVELTESTMFNNEEIMLAVLDKLHQAGFTLSMDDFGTGYSSLSLLKNLPIDVIKIDRHFFTSSNNKARTKTVIENVIQMAKQLSIHTVAEGVEVLEQVEFLREVGCDIVQGYYYAKPLPVSEFQISK